MEERPLFLLSFLALLFLLLLLLLCLSPPLLLATTSTRVATIGVTVASAAVVAIDAADGPMVCGGSTASATHDRIREAACMRIGIGIRVALSGDGLVALELDNEVGVDWLLLLLWLWLFHPAGDSR